MLVCTTAAPAQDRDDETIADQGLGQVERFGAELRKLGSWDDQYATLERMIDRMWAQNGWEAESDTFARKLMLDVSAVPPWEFARRTETAVQAVADRYRMTSAQTNQLRAQVYLRTGKLIFRNTGLIFKQTREVIDARLSGKPLTPEQVARWVSESDDLLTQARAEFDAMVHQVSRTFTPEQQRILKRDMASYHRRVKAFNAMRETWRQGNWQPQDWGLDNDPIQTSGDPIAKARYMHKMRTDARRLQRQYLSQPRYQACDETSWQRYVRMFITAYHLDDGQAGACHSILRELELRAHAYRLAHRRELAQVPRSARPFSIRYRRIRALFDELKRRLDPIPTSAQRRAAKPVTPR